MWLGLWYMLKLLKMVGARQNRPERVYHAPTIIKCFNMYQSHHTGESHNLAPSKSLII